MRKKKMTMTRMQVLQMMRYVVKYIVVIKYTTAAIHKVYNCLLKNSLLIFSVIRKKLQ